MTSRRSGVVAAAALMACLVWSPCASAQGIEVTPLAGYRFGNDFYELITGRSVDVDGAVAFGGVLNVPVSNGTQFEALVTHQQADILVAPSPFGLAVPQRISVDHWQGGGLQEFGAGRVRPFMTALLGLSRYAGAGDSEVRFTLSGGGGTKLFPVEHLGIRLDGRIFATFIDAGGSAFACAPGVCLVNLHASVVWQAEFTAGVVVRFGNVLTPSRGQSRGR